jgi:hypothetical protein
MGDVSSGMASTIIQIFLKVSRDLSESSGTVLGNKRWHAGVPQGKQRHLSESSGSVFIGMAILQDHHADIPHGKH